MGKTCFIGVVLIVFLSVGIAIASAHQPTYADSQTAITIPDASISRAYYGALTGVPVVYTLSSEKEFSLYLNILAPYLEGAHRDFNVQVTDSTGVLITELSAPEASWEKWYEEFAGDWYWKGPELRKTLPAGTYTITVSNPENTGKYVLAPGEAEVFTAGGTLGTIGQLYEVKVHFFDKPWYALFEGIIGKALLGIIVVGVLIITGIAYALRRRIT